MRDETRTGWIGIAAVAALLAACDVGEKDDGSRGIDQEPIAIRLVNALDHPVYVQLTEGSPCHQAQPVVERQVDGAWEPVDWFLPWSHCMCAELEPDESCECEGDLVNWLSEIPAGGEISVVWDGMAYEQDDPDHPWTHSCYWDAPLEAGRYRLSVEVFSAYSSEYDANAAPNAQGVIEWAEGVGPSTVRTAELELPTIEEAVTITIE